MEKEQTQHKEILDKVDDLSDKVGALSDKTDEILEAVGHFSDKTQERLDTLDKDMASVKSHMVTKDYFDEKLSDFKGDLTVLMRKEDRKLTTLVGILETKKVISPEDAHKVLEMEPFPQSR